MAFSDKRMIAPPSPPHFCKNYLYEGIDLETWNLVCDTTVPPLAQGKYDFPPSTPRGTIILKGEFTENDTYEPYLKL